MAAPSGRLAELIEQAKALIHDHEEFFFEFVPDGQYVSTLNQCNSEYTQAHDAFMRTAGANDVRMAHEYIPSGVLEESAVTELVSTNAISMTGRQRLDYLLLAISIIDGNKFALSERQATIVYDTYVVASLQKIFGEELTANIDYIMKRFHIEELFQDVFVMMQRRGGKTIVTSIYIICFAMTQISGNINVYGKSKRVTKMIKDLVKELYFVLQDSKQFGATRIVEDNDERLAILTRYGTINRCNFYPCNSEVHSMSILFL